MHTCMHIHKYMRMNYTGYIMLSCQKKTHNEQGMYYALKWHQTKSIFSPLPPTCCYLSSK